MDAVLNTFRELLHCRLEKGVFTTEDSVRYMLFAALMDKARVRPEDITLEYPHPTISGAKVDMWVPNFEGRTLAVEFKYDRQASNETQRAGAVFRDVHRLLLIDGTLVRRVFVYLTAWEMANYFESPKNGFAEFWQLEPQKVLTLKAEYFLKRSATFRNALGGEFEVEVKSLYKATLPQKHSLRVWAVQEVA